MYDSNNGGTYSPPPPAPVRHLLLESGYKLLLESGNPILLEG